MASIALPINISTIVSPTITPITEITMNPPTTSTQQISPVSNAIDVLMLKTLQKIGEKKFPYEMAIGGILILFMFFYMMRKK